MGDPVTDLASNRQEQGGAPRDIRALYQAEFARICRLMRRLGVPDKDLEDAVQDVFMVVHRRWEDLDPDRPAHAWLGGIAVRVASQWRRKASVRHESGGEVPESASSAPGADAVLEARRARARVLAGLDELPEDQRAVFVLHELEGCAIPEIAAALGIPANTAYSRLRLGRERFARAVKGATPNGGSHG
jgi:RNA polymerase sigma-70 factor (ECF subfamily)